MSDEKITVSWDDLNSPEIDVRIKQQGIISRTQEHYQQHVAPPAIPSARPVPQRNTSIWYNSLFYTAVFGLVGGLFGWLLGEFVFLVIPNRLEEFNAVIVAQNEIASQVTRGTISEQEGRRREDQLARTYQGNPYVAIIMDKSLSAEEGRHQMNEQIGKDKTRSLVSWLLYSSSIGITLAFFLAVADQAIGRNWRGLVIYGAIAVALGLLGGVIGGFIGQCLYGALGGGTAEAGFAIQMIVRAVGWACVGLFLAVAPGLVMRSWKRCCIGIAGGFCGGLLGGILFDPIAMATGSALVSRFVGIIGIGLLAGLGTGLIEKAAKSGWLKVVAGLIAGKQFIIYKNPTYIGSSPQCEVYLFKDTQVGPRHAAIRAVPGGYEIEDLQSPSGTFVNGQSAARTRLRNNDQVQIGATVFQFQEKARTVT